MNHHQGKIRVAVIFGGRSGEHEVSLASAKSVMAALDPAKYEVVPIGISKEGEWLAGEAWQALMMTSTTSEAISQTMPVTLLPNPQQKGLVALSPLPQAVPDLAVDVVIPVLHGPYGEDGTLQGLLELANLPYVGSGVVGSAVGMDKGIFKGVMQAAGLPILPWQLVPAREVRGNLSALVAALEANFSYPMFVKPANLGSSVGISKCMTGEELVAGLQEAARYDRRLIVEQGRPVRELEVAVLGNDQPRASIVGEIRPRRAFYDYVAKYVSDDSELLIPAPLADETTAVVQTLALRAFQAIDGAGLARVDLMLDQETGELFINEVNTFPGFTQISMYPKLWQASGVPYGALLDELIALALARHAEKQALATSFTVPEVG
jgi:D-alanine-D-alanine ligase